MLLSLCPFAFAANAIKNGSRVEFGSYPQTMMTDEDLIAALDAKATSWTSYNYSYRVAGLDTVQKGDFMKYCDVTYNGVKYRGVKMTAYRPERTDDMCIRPLNAKYELNKTYWFEYQPLTWLVLDVSTGLMICDQIIDAQPFFSGGLTYYPGNAVKYQYKTAVKDYPNIYGAATGSIGAWLPDTFCYTAFSNVERSKLQAHLVNRSNTDSNFNKSNFSTSVFLLTLSEVSTYMPLDSHYPTENNRGAKSSDYAKIQGAESFYYCQTEEDYFYENYSRFYEAMGNSSWLTATSGNYSHYAKCIAATGNSENVDVRYSRAGIRPAVQLGSANLQTLSAHQHDYVDIGRTEPTCTNPGVTEETGWYCTICNLRALPELEEHIVYDMGEDHDFHVDDTACTAGDALMFGSYPQSRVYDDDVISQLSTMQLTWKSYDYYTFYDSVKGAFVKSDYMKYTDVDLDGDGRNDYRGVTFSKYRPGTAFSTGISNMKYCWQYQNGYYTNTVYWFKYEPLIWRVLDRDNGILMCEYAIDAQAFNDIYYEVDLDENEETDDFEYFLDKKGEVYANDYTQSSLRKYLNGSFLNTAFSSAEKKSLADTTVAVKGESFSGIGIRSEEYYSSVTDKVFLLSFNEYVYSGLINNCDDTCAVYPTDYARCQGCRDYDDEDGTIFWLRNSSDSDACRAQIMYKCSEDNDGVDSSSFGIAPVIKVNNIEELLHVHDIVYDEEVPATCTKDGKTAGKHCATCGKIFIKQEKIDKLGHDPKPVAAVAPTCETAGCNTYYVCTRCEKAFEDAACTVATTVKTQTLAALGHDWDEGTVTKVPTCTLKGSATLTCQRAGCDKTKTETIPVDENAHIWGAWTTVTAPTCTAAGSEKRVCTNNKNHTETSTIAPIGHDWDEGTVTTPATCVKEGEKTYSCKRAGCTETKTVTIAKDAAKHGEKEIKNAAAATCGKDGYTGDTYCKDCGAKTAAGTVIKVTGAHTWDAGKVTKEASIGVPGVKTYTCTVCGNTKTEEIPALKQSYTPGDVDEDGKITAADARLALRRSVSLEDYKEGSPKFLACDVDFDGKVTAADARLILRASVGLEDAKTWKPAK